jgi:L-aminopeptidase/D-esterase-like protein
MDAELREVAGITAIDGLLVGHATDLNTATGCTVVLCPAGAVASVDVRGGAPATRETDVLRPGNLVDRVHGVLLAGGSAFGLDAAAGVMRWLEERGHGFPVRSGVVPIVAAAALFDLALGSPAGRPDAAAGYAACIAASAGPVVEGTVGAGTGATVGKALDMERAVKGGIGTAAERTASGVAVAALVAVNAWGEVVDPGTARVVAGPRTGERGFADTIEIVRARPPLSPFTSENSTLGVIATDATLTKEDCARLATMGHAGMARAIRPVHTPVDGDVLFALATCEAAAETDLVQLGALAARAVERAVVRAVQAATGLAGVPSASEWTAA